MSGSARRPHFRTRELARLKAKADARRQEFDAFFAQHYLDVKARLKAATKSLDDKRYYWRTKRLKAAHDQELDESPARFGRIGRRPQLWQIEGDGCGK
jgi:hypothetical protein